MKETLNDGSLKFFLGFVGILSLGFFVLFAVGFYQVEMAGDKNVSSVGVAEQGQER